MDLGIVLGGLRRCRGVVRRPGGVAGSAIVLLLSAAAILSPALFPAGADAQSGDALAGLSPAHPFGTDELGRDVLVRTVYALRVSIALVLAAVPASFVLGTLMGLSGFASRLLGELCQRCFDLVLGFPGLILGMTVVLVVGPGWTSLGATIVLSGVPHFGRLARGALLAEKDKDYVLAAQFLGVGKADIMLRHILPNALDPLIVQMALSMVSGVFIEAALSIVGLGFQPPTPSLGTLLNAGIRYVYDQPLYMLCPILALLLLALAFNLVADALNEAAGRSARP